MKKKLSVLVNDLADYKSYVNFLEMAFDVELVKLSTIDKKAENPKIVDLMLFTGGEDVDPNYYNERVGKYTSTNPNRDSVESKMYRMFGMKVPKLGICRGSQFLTVMNGGSLIQHVENHGIGGTHSITLNHLYNHKIQMTSTHHQMMYPFVLPKKDYILCAYATNYLSPVYWNGDNKNRELSDEFLEPEIVYYPNSNSLAIQGHPESGVMKDSEKEFVLDYISRILKL